MLGRGIINLYQSIKVILILKEPKIQLTKFLILILLIYMRKYRQINLLGLIICFFCFLWLIQSAQAEDSFDPNYIISDQDAIDYNCINEPNIHDFLKSKGGTLYSYQAPNKEGALMKTSQILYQVAQEWRISPKFLIVLIQKESSLVTNPNPNRELYDQATGYFCFDGQGCNPKYLGLFKQINSAAAQFRSYFDDADDYKIKPGKSTVIEGQTIVPQNQATANMYTYTPHILGNKNFWKIWNDWFKTSFPDGLLLRAKDSTSVWLTEKNTRREIKSKTVLISRFNANNIINVDQQTLEKINIGAPLIYPQYSLVKDSLGKIFLIIDNYKREISSIDLFKQLGFNKDEIIAGQDEDLTSYLTGLPITANTSYPTGALFQEKETGDIYYVMSGSKKLIIDKSVLAINFKKPTIKKVAASELDNYMPQEPLKVQDGELIVSDTDPTVYFISGGARRAIPTAELFKQLGYKWSSIYTVPQKVVDLHPLGENLKLSEE